MCVWGGGGVLCSPLVYQSILLINSLNISYQLTKHHFFQWFTHPSECTWFYPNPSWLIPIGFSSSSDHPLSNSYIPLCLHTLVNISSTGRPLNARQTKLAVICRHEKRKVFPEMAAMQAQRKYNKNHQNNVYIFMVV